MRKDASWAFKVARDITSRMETDAERGSASARTRGRAAKPGGALSTGAFISLRKRARSCLSARRPYFDLLGARDIIGKSIREVVPEVAGQGTGFDDVYQGCRLAVPTSPFRRGHLERILEFVYQVLRGRTVESRSILAPGIG